MLPKSYLNEHPTLSNDIGSGKTTTNVERSAYANYLREQTRDIISADKLELFRSSLGNKDAKLVEHTQPYELFRTIYQRNPLVANGIDNTVDFAVQAGFEIGAEQESDKKNIEKFYDEYNFSITKASIMKQMLLYGNSFLELGGVDENGFGKINSLKLLPVEQMYVEVSTGSLDNGQVTGYVQKINDQEKVRWTPEQIIHFKWNEFESSFYGMSDLLRLLSDLTRLENYKEDLGIILHRYANAILHWKVGSEEKPGTQGQVEDFLETVENREVGEDIVTSSNINADILVPNLKMIQPDGMIEFQENQLIAGLRVPEIFVRGGRTSNKATADVEAQMFDRKVNALRKITGMLIEDLLFPKITRGKATIEWNELTIEGKEIQSKTVQSFVMAGIPLKVAMQIVGLGSWTDETEAEKKKELENTPPIQRVSVSGKDKEKDTEKDTEEIIDQYKEYIEGR